MASNFESLPKYAQSYYESILADYESVPVPDPNDAVALKAAVDAKAIVARHPDIGWKDIYVLEIAVVRLQSLEKLRRRAWAIRTKYKQAVAPEVYAAYENSKPPEPATAQLADLRADIEKILEEFHWLYTTGRARDERFRRTKELLVEIGALLAAIVVGLSFLGNFSVLGVIAISGMAGALMSIIRRLQDVGLKSLSTSDPIMDLSGLDAGFIGIAIALFSGAIFAVLLYMLFIAGMSNIAGELVPKIVANGTRPGCAGLSFTDFASCTGPASGIDFAKLVIWSFIAGFAERLVPDVLDRIAQKASKSSGDSNKK